MMRGRCALSLRAAARAPALLCGRAPSLLRPALAPSPLHRGCVGLRFGSGKAEEAPKAEAAAEATAPVLVYEGAKNKIVTTLKMASIANLGFALSSVPILQYITQATGNPGKGAAMSSLVRSCPL